MIQPLFNGMLAILLAKFLINDLPHAAGLTEPDYEREPTTRQLRYIAILCQQLKMTVAYEEQVKTFGEAGRMIRELEAEREHRRGWKKLKRGNPDAMSGEEIARELGIRYDGIQEGLGMQFTDTPQTGTTFYANTLEEARAGLAEKRELFRRYEKPGTATGTCYSDAWRFLIKEEAGYLIHGSVQLTAEGARVNHAWVELPTGWIWEPQTKSYYTTEDFKIMNPIEEHRYTATEAAIMAARTSSHGPWSDEDRASWLRR